MITLEIMVYTFSKIFGVYLHFMMSYQWIQARKLFLLQWRLDCIRERLLKKSFISLQIF